MRNETTAQLTRTNTVRSGLAFLVDASLYTAALVSSLVIVGALAKSAWNAQTFAEPRTIALLTFLTAVGLGCTYWWVGLWRGGGRMARDR